MQRLRISGFLGIDDADIALDGLTALIGAQASGKSVIARLFYFFNEYFSEFDEIALLKGEHKTTFDSKKKQDFCKIFPTYAWIPDEFEIIYNQGDHQVVISSVAGRSSVDIKTSPSVASYFRSLKTSFAEFKRNYSDEELYAPTRVLREFRRSMVSENIDKFERPLFVPASRSFYSTIREEIFSILSIDEKIDSIIMQFGEFYESAKMSVYLNQTRRKTNGEGDKVLYEYFRDIIKGEYARIDNRDWIEMPRGRIELSKASSGQQEALPLLVTLARFPAPGRTLIIEEPEAHLFPESQVKILEFIYQQCVSRNTDILFTTHSPYLLSALNNHILKREVGEGQVAASILAYSLGGGKSSSIVDPETSLISADYIDSVSERINAEFLSIMEDRDV